MNVPFRLVCLSQISIGISLETDGIDHSLVVHQFVQLGLVKGVELIGFRIPDNLVGFVHCRFARFLEWLLDFIQHVLPHNAVIQLGFSFTVETKTSHFAFDLSLLGFIPIILGTSRHEFDDVIILFQFTGKLAEVVA